MAEATTTTTSTTKTTTTPSIYGGSYWAASPMSVCWQAMIEAMQNQIESMNAYALYEMDLWDNSKGKDGLSTMMYMSKTEYDQMRKAGEEQKKATQEEANKNIAGCVGSATSAVASVAVPKMNDQTQKSEAQIQNATNTKTGLQNLRNGASQNKSGTGEAPAAAKGEALPEADAQGYRNAVKQHSTLDVGNNNQATKFDEIQVTAPGKPSKPMRDVLNAAGEDELLDNKIVQTNEELKTAYGNRNQAEQQNQYMVQMATNVVQMAQQAATAGFGYNEAEHQEKQAEHNSEAQFGRTGKSTYDEMDRTYEGGNQNAQSNASKTLDILSRLASGA
ncbi:MAG: hypothetical protein FJZ56_02565 [Chlamydiae bacterium]|nr:hypothetical protein [Chlamydiota bacterium]